MRLEGKNKLAPLIVEAYRKERKRNEKKHERKSVTYFRASGLLGCSLTDTCPRQLYWKILNPKEPSDEMLQVFGIGHAVHNYFQYEVLGRSDITILSIEERMRLYDPVEIHGRADAIIRIDGDRHVVEIKSASPKFFAFISNRGMPPESHYSQIQIYLHSFNIKDGILFYVNKTTGEILDFHVKYDEEYVSKLLDIHIELLKQILDEKIPDVPDSVNRWRFPCKWSGGQCTYYDECQEADK